MKKIKIAINRRSTGKLPPGDPAWATFNDDFENKELEPIGIVEAVYGGHAYTTWHNGRRKLENFVLAQHVAIDMDTGDERSDRSTLLANPWVRSYACVIHPTPSSTTEAPRSRVIFALDQPVTNADNYRKLAEFMVSQFDGADSACVDASRFFYGCKGADIWFDNNVLPLAHVRHFYRRATLAAAPTARARIEAANNPKVIRMDERRAERIIEMTHGDALPDMEKCLDALRTINPYSVDYNRWIGLISALKRDYGDAARAAVIAWAQGKPGEVERIWDKQIDVNRAGGMHAASVYWMARGG